MKKSHSSGPIENRNPENSNSTKTAESVNENFFQAMFEAHQAVMLLIDPHNGSIIDGNKAALQFYKYSKEELIKLKIQDINQLEPEEVRAEWMKALREERNYFIFPHKLADGQIRHVEVYSSSFTYQGKPVLYSIIHDITEKKVAEEALRISEEKFEVAFKSNPNAFILSALKSGKIYEVNDTFCTLTGYTKEEALGLSTLELELYDSPADRKKMVGILKKKGSLKNFEIKLRHRTGKVLCVLLSSEFLKTSLGETILTTFQDITERKRLEDQRNKEHNLLQTIFDTVPAMVSVYDPDIQNVQLNRELERVTGWTTEETKNRNIMELVYPDPTYRQEIAQYMQSLAPGFRDIVMTCKNGTTIDTLWANVSTSDGRRIGIGIDITERKKAQEDLLKSKNIITTALASMTDAVYISDEKGSLIEYNDAYFTFYRFNPDKMFTKDVHKYYSHMDFHLPDGKLATQEERPISRALRGETVKEIEYSVTRKETGESWVGSFSFAPIRNPEGTITGSVIVARDVTENKQAEKERERLIEQLAREKDALAESEEKYRIMGEAVDYGVWATDAEGKVTYLSESFCNLVGKSFEELKENGWHEHLVFEQSQEIMNLWMHSVKTGEPYEHEHMIISKDGEPKHILARARPIRNKDGEIIAWAGIHLDITERKKVNERLSEQNKNLTRINKVLEDFVHIAAHDLRSPISNLINIGELIATNTDAEKKTELFRLIMPVTKKLQQTVDGLLEMVSIQMEEDVNAELVHFNDVWKNIQEVLAPEIKAYPGEIEVEFKNAPVIIYGNIHLTSILRNLVSNAIKYSEGCENPKIIIRTNIKDDYILLEIHDNGIGIDLKKAKKGIFKPFRRFTNKAGGTGMGLYIIKNIIEKNGGYIRVESEPNKGSSFYCYLKKYYSKKTSH